MEVSIKNKVLHITHNLKSNEIYKVKQSSKFENVTIMKKPIVCAGFSSRTQDNKDILLLDYDSVAYNVVLSDIDYLQENCEVSHAYIFTTRQKIENKEYVGNYHVVFLSKHIFSNIIEMLKCCHIDANFIDSPLRTKYRSYVLRLSAKANRNKPKFIQLYLSKKALINKGINPQISTAHKKLLSKFYKNIFHPKYKKEDNLQVVRLQEYETLK